MYFRDFFQLLSPPVNTKHVLAPLQSFGNWDDSSPVGKNSNITPFFLHVAFRVVSSDVYFFKFTKYPSASIYIYTFYSPTLQIDWQKILRMFRKIDVFKLCGFSFR